jgi:hypothetical protein
VINGIADCSVFGKALDNLTIEGFFSVDNA